MECMCPHTSFRGLTGGTDSTQLTVTALPTQQRRGGTCRPLHTALPVTTDHDAAAAVHWLSAHIRSSRPRSFTHCTRQAPAEPRDGAVGRATTIRNQAGMAARSLLSMVVRAVRGLEAMLIRSHGINRGCNDASGVEDVANYKEGWRDGASYRRPEHGNIPGTCPYQRTRGRIEWQLLVFLGSFGEYYLRPQLLISPMHSC